MLTLVSGASRTHRPDHVGHLLVPRTWSQNREALIPGKWAMDNGAFSGFDEGAYMRMLENYHGVPGCVFVTAPDVVGDAAATTKRWPFWSRLLRGIRHIPAYVAQDGLTPELLPQIEALFIGGTTKFKESEQARQLCQWAKARGIWVHWGRVNGKRRYELALMAGADSIDGTGFSMFPDTNIPLIAQWDAEIAAQPVLDMGA